jgi:hypothetical protein
MLAAKRQLTDPHTPRTFPFAAAGAAGRRRCAFAARAGAGAAATAAPELVFRRATEDDMDK